MTSGYPIAQNLLNALPSNELNLEEATKICQLSNIRTFDQEETVLHLDQDFNCFYLILDGEVAIRLRRRKIKNYGPGDLFGEVGIFSEYRFGYAQALSKTTIAVFDRDKVLNPEYLDHALINKLIVGLTKKMINYFHDEVKDSAKNLITNGESQTVEFKAHADDSTMREAIVRSLAAFMNASGGTVLVGVRDDGTIAGIPHNGKNLLNLLDKFDKDINSKIKDRLNPFLSDLVECSLDFVENRPIFRIDCQAAQAPVFFNIPISAQQTEDQDVKELFLVRTGRSNSKIKKISDVMAYVSKRFGILQSL